MSKGRDSRRTIASWDFGNTPPEHSTSSAQRLPLIPLVQHAHATNDVLTYARETDDWEQELYPAAYSELGSAAVSEAFIVMPAVADEPFHVGGLLRMTGGVIGNLTGETVAEHEAEKRGKVKTTRNHAFGMIEYP